MYNVTLLQSVYMSYPRCDKSMFVGRQLYIHRYISSKK